jgi:hypothetical protein
MGAKRVDEADGTGGITKGDKVFPELANTYGGTIRLREFAAKQHRQPIASL